MLFIIFRVFDEVQEHDMFVESFIMMVEIKSTNIEHVFERSSYLLLNYMLQSSMKHNAFVLYFGGTVGDSYLTPTCSEPLRTLDRILPVLRPSTFVRRKSRYLSAKVNVVR